MKLKYMLGLGVGLALGFLGAQSASATPSSNEIVVGQSPVTDRDRQSFSEQWEAIARLKGISIDAAYAKYEPEIDADTHLNEIRSVFGSDLLRIGFRGDENVVAPIELLLTVANPLSTQEREVLTRLELNTVVTVDPSILSEDTLSAINVNLFLGLLDNVGDIPLQTSPDAYTNDLHFTIGGSAIPQASGGTSEQTARTLDPVTLQAIRDYLAANVPAGVGVFLTVDPTLAETAQSATTYISGGDNALAAGCNAAFTVKVPNYVGVVTTSHCAGLIPTYEGMPTTNGAAVPLLKGDMTVLKLPTGIATPNFVTGVSSSVDITAVAAPTTGNTVCIFQHGLVPATQCDTVMDTLVCKNRDDGVHGCDLATTQHAFTVAGDSGSGWYSGSIAFGVHWGQYTEFGLYHSAFGRASALAAFGIHVVTTADVIGIA